MIGSTSLVYSHPVVYHWVMRLLYGRAFEARYEAINALIADGLDVFEACAGDAYLYQRHLSKRNIRYMAGDINERFLLHARREQIPMQRFDLARDAVPSADVVVLQASLYQFMPEHEHVVKKLLSAARRTLIISEPIKNLASDGLGPIAWLARRATNPGDGEKPLRFNERSLDEFFNTHFASRVERSILIPGGREKIYCLRASP